MELRSEGCSCDGPDLRGDPRVGHRNLLTRALLALAACVPLAACSSSTPAPEASSEARTEVRYRALAKNVSFGLVNASSTDRTSLYSTSKPLDQATTKVSPDEVIDALVEHFRDEGYFEIALRGPSPRVPPTGASQILEVSLPDGEYHAILAPGVTAQFAGRFQTCARALLEIYNNTIQLQAVDEAPAWGGTSSRPRGGSGKSGG